MLTCSQEEQHAPGIDTCLSLFPQCMVLWLMCRWAPCRGGVLSGGSWTATARTRHWSCHLRRLCTCTVHISSAGAEVGQCVQPQELPIRVCLQPRQPWHSCAVLWCYSAGDLWEECRTSAFKGHLRNLSYTGLLPHTTHPESINQQRSNVFCYVCFDPLLLDVCVTCGCPFCCLVLSSFLAVHPRKVVKGKWAPLRLPHL